MNLNLKKRLIGMIAIIFSLSFVMSQIMLVNIHAQETSLLDFSNEASLDTMTLNSVDLLEKITSQTIIQSEKDYLSQFHYDFKYEGKIATTFVDSKIENNQLFVYANSYSYMDVNDRKVNWIPQQIIFEDERFDLVFNETKQSYECIIPYINSDTTTIDVVYTCDFALNKDIVNKMANLAYNKADEYVKQDIIGKANLQYQNEMNQYNQQVLDYQTYLENLDVYYQEEEKYQEYLKQKNQYDLKCRTYEQYLKQYNQYLLDKKEYDQYLIDKEKFLRDNLLYQNYLNEKEQYDIAYQKYLEDYQNYLTIMNNIQYRLDLMNLIKTPMTSLNRSIYNAVMGSAVTQILDRKDELEVLNVDVKLIETAEKATKQLRIYFKDYFEICKSDEERYVYYKTNYGTNYEKGGAIKYYLVSLFTSLEKLYRSGLVPQGLDYMNKRKEFVILLAQLAYVSDAISQDAVYTYEGKKNGKEIVIYGNNPWKIDGKTVLEILENDVNFQIDKSLARPKENYPSMPNEPTAPTVIEKPIEPTCSIQSEPIQPKEVLPPGTAPIVVEQPILPTEVFMPQTQPVPPTFDEKIVALINDYEEGNLKFREELKSDYILSLESSFSKSIVNNDLIQIDFYSEDNRFLGTNYTDKGSFIVYSGEKVSKNEDQIFKTYEFDYWQYEDGEILNLNNVVKSGKVFPIFKGITYQTYEIIWQIDKQSIVEQYQYGDLPHYSGECIKESSKDFEYYFTSWDKNIETVTQNETYTAIFEEVRRYYITWVIDGKDFTEIYYYNEKPEYKDIVYKAYDKQYYYEFISWDRKIENVTENTTYTAMFSKNPIVQNNQHKIEIKYDESNKEITLDIEGETQIDLQKLFELILYENPDYSLQIHFNRGSIILPDIAIAQIVNKNVKTLTLNIQDKGNYEYYLNINIFDKDGKILDIPNIEIQVNGEFDAAHSSLYEILDDNNEQPVRIEIFNNQQIKTMIENGVNYHIYPMYSIVCDSNEIISIQTNKTKARIGETITIQTQLLKPGINLEEVIVLDSKENKIQLINNQFLMGSSDVNIITRYKEIIYIVEFYVEGELYSSKQYKYGDEIILPSNPIKADEYDWSYTFIGWDKQIKKVVDCDATYTAVFDKTEIIHPVEPKRIRLVVIVRIVLATFVGLIVIGITLIILKKKGIILKKKA